MSFGKGSNTTTQTTGPSAQAMGAYTNLLGRAQDVSNTPYTAYSGEMVAPVNAQQQTGIGNINANAGFAMPFIGQAAQYANNAAQPITGSQIAQYQSPYTQQVVDATQRQFNNQNAQQQSALTGNAAAQGALGGDRVGVAQGILAGQQSLAQAPVIAGLYNSGYQNAEQMALTQQQAQGNAAYSLGNLGVAGQQAALSGAGAQVGAGSLQQQTQQALDAAHMQQFYQQQAYPFQTAQWLAGLTTGVGSQMGGTSTTTPPPPNPWNTIAGLGLGAASIFARDGGRIHRDLGGGLGGAPYGGGASWVPTLNITGGSGAPKPPAAPGQQQQNPFGNLKTDIAAGKGIKNLWNKYGPQAGPLDLGSAAASPDGMGALQEIGTSPELGFGFGGLYRDGGAVRHFEDGGLALAGYGTGAVLPFDERFAPADQAVREGVFDPQGANASAFSDAPPVAPRAKPSIGDADLPIEIAAGSSRPSALAEEADSSLAYAPEDKGAPQGLGDAPAAMAEQATEGGQGGLLSRFGVNLDPDLRRSLMAAGFGLMASKSPFLGQAIGEAGLAGMGTYSGIQEEKRKAAKSDADIQHGKDQLAQAAKIAQDRLKAEQGHWTQQAGHQTDVLKETQRQHEQQAKHQESVLEETRRQHEMALKAPVSLGADPRTGMPIMALPRINKATGGLDYYLIGPNGQISDTPLGAPASPPSPTLSPGVAPTGPTSALPSAPGNAQQPTRTAALDTGSVSDAPKPGEGIIQHNQRVAQAGAFNYGTDAPYIEKGMDVPDPSPLAGRSVQALKTDSEYYLQTGKLPTVAKGNSPVALVQQQYQNAVKNYGNALAQSRGMKPDEIAEAWRTAPGMLRFVLGADGRSTVSLGTAVRHLDTIKQLADAWKEGSTVGNWQTWNRVTSSVRREFGDAAVTNLESAARIVGPEIIKALGVAGAGTEHDRDTAAGQFLTSKGIDQIHGAIKTTQALLGGQLEGRERQAMNAGVSKDRFKSLIGDRAYEILSTADKGGHGAAAAPAVTPQQQQAIDWANKNPNDPRAIEIKKRLGAP